MGRTSKCLSVSWNANKCSLTHKGDSTRAVACQKAWGFMPHIDLLNTINDSSFTKKSTTTSTSSQRRSSTNTPLGLHNASGRSKGGHLISCAPCVDTTGISNSLIEAVKDVDLSAEWLVDHFLTQTVWFFSNTSNDSQSHSTLRAFVSEAQAGYKSTCGCIGGGGTTSTSPRGGQHGNFSQEKNKTHDQSRHSSKNEHFSTDKERHSSGAGTASLGLHNRSDLVACAPRSGTTGIPIPPALLNDIPDLFRSSACCNKKHRASIRRASIADKAHPFF